MGLLIRSDGVTLSQEAFHFVVRDLQQFLRLLEQIQFQ